MTPAAPPQRIARTARLSGAAYLALAQALVVALGYITHVLVGKIGGPPLYGVYGVILALMTIMNLPLTFGIPIATSKAVAEDEANSGGVFLPALRAQMFCAMVLSLATVLLAVPVAHLLGDPKLIPLIRFAALIAPAQASYALLANYFNGLHAFAAQARLITLYSLFKLAGSVGFLAWFRSVPGALSGFLVGGVLATLIGLRQALPTIRGHVRSRIPSRRLLVFAGTFFGMAVALQTLTSIDLLLVKRLLANDTLVGYYNAASTIARIPYFILQGIGAVFLPSVARLLTEDPGRARDFMQKVFRYVALLLLPIAALSAATSKALVALFFSRAYLPSAPVLTVLSIGFGLLSAFYLFATIAAGAGKSRVPLVMASALIPISATIGWFLIPRVQLLGAAVGTLTAAGSGALCLAAYMYWRFQLRFPLSTTIRGTTATVIAVVPTYFVTPPTFLLPFWYLLLLSAYGLTLVALGEIRHEDWTMVRTLIPGRRPDAISRP